MMKVTKQIQTLSDNHPHPYAVPQENHTKVSVSTDVQPSHFANKRQSVSDVTSPLMSKDFTSLVNKKEIEIAKLRGKNNELIMQLKRLNEELDQKVGNARLGANKAKSENPEAQETKIVNEIECLGKMCKLYETELEQLRAKAKVRADTETVVEMEKKIVVENEKQNALQKKIRKLQKKVKDGEKSIERSVKRFEDGIPQLEEDKLLVLFNRELQKTEDLERKLKQQADVVVTKDIKCDELREKAQGLESEIEELKRLAKMVAPQNESENTTKNCSIEELREKVKQAKTELEVETAKNAKELKAQQEILTMLHDKYHDLEQQNKINAHKLLELTRINKLTKRKSMASLPPRKTLLEIKKEEIISRIAKMKKYKKKIKLMKKASQGDLPTEIRQSESRELPNKALKLYKTTEKAGRNKIPSNTKS